MKLSGEYRGLKWNAEAEVKIDFAVGGQHITKSFGEMPSDEEITAVAERFMESSVDGLGPLEAADVSEEAPKPKRKR